MKHHAGLDLSMKARSSASLTKPGGSSSEKDESTPEAIATLLERYSAIERAVIETGRMSPAICLGLRELGIPVVCIDAKQAPRA
ncbi:transposase [Novosphingobium chloroacetimidivorans]|uniref:Transposase n=1 Tax=Novosphingobium chloroacetimidivorans TaxID=1428314 RepID=A0A7W7KEX9_9SPHN|nr:hypothetical protein [Novosphingobium chloroacetimidivorans]MBB4860994.1 transposase [Novosphingobium chloroacetimidivorans]